MQRGEALGFHIAQREGHAPPEVAAVFIAHAELIVGAILDQKCCPRAEIPQQNGRNLEDVRVMFHGRHGRRGLEPRL
jgi:hypothetical protein